MVFIKPFLGSALFAATTFGSEQAPSRASDFQAAPCTVTQFSQVADATASCSAITFQDLKVPAGKMLNLVKLKTGTRITFAGRTTFGYAEKREDQIQIGGRDIVVEGAPGHIIDGNGPQHWDGGGSNTGRTKPNTFIALKKMVGNSIVRNLNILNFPVHCFLTTGSQGLLMENIVLDNRAGDKPNSESGKKSAGHNTDGFGFQSSDNIVLRNSKVWNQDDCVAITSGTNITVHGMYCHGGHGLSIGSVGGKNNNTVKDITIRDSVLVNHDNGIRIKTNSGTTGEVTRVTFKNIKMENTLKYGLVIQQDYLNGGPTGEPTSGVKISDITISNVTGTAGPKARNYYILCGDQSCTNMKIDGVSITGGKKGDYCNNRWEGDFQCPTVKPSNLN